MEIYQNLSDLTMPNPKYRRIWGDFGYKGSWRDKMGYRWIWINRDLLG